jgi:hypothetical protein
MSARSGRIGPHHDDIAESLRKCHDLAISGARPAIEVDQDGGEPPCGRLAKRSFFEIGRQLAVYRLVFGIPCLVDPSVFGIAAFAIADIDRANFMESRPP